MWWAVITTAWSRLSLAEKRLRKTLCSSRSHLLGGSRTRARGRIRTDTEKAPLPGAELVLPTARSDPDDSPSRRHSKRLSFGRKNEHALSRQRQTQPITGSHSLLGPYMK